MLVRPEDIERKTIQHFCKHLRCRMPEDVAVLRILEKEYLELYKMGESKEKKACVVACR